MEEIGHKLRQLRKSNKLSLKQLAERTGCSTSYLSMVENGKVDPSVSRLKKITDALRVTIIDLFQDQLDSNIIIRKQERIHVEFPGSKTKIEILVPNVPEKQIDARLTVIAPGGSSNGDYLHPGVEFGLVLKGRLDLVVGGVSHQLLENDSFYFSSTQKHSYENSSEEETVVVWVNHPPSL